VFFAIFAVKPLDHFRVNSEGLKLLDHLSSPPNSPFASPNGADSQAPATLSPIPPPRLPAEDPAWTGWDVLQLALLTFLAPFVFLTVIASVAHKSVYKGTPLIELVQKPPLVLLAQMLAYVVVVLCMIALVQGRSERRFSEAICWNWPKQRGRLVILGVGLLLAPQLVAYFLPIPRNLPFDRFFEHRLDAFLTSAFAISFGPLVEELFFRGFLYPVLARRLGIGAGVLLTATGFALVHTLQLAFAWAAVLVIFIVGVVLTLVRATTHSVGSSFLVHIAYNCSLTALTLIGTDGFRHLDKL
jgi:hypothetical protein